jgi:hypothetical protein
MIIIFTPRDVDAEMLYLPLSYRRSFDAFGGRITWGLHNISIGSRNSAWEF